MIIVLLALWIVLSLAQGASRLSRRLRAAARPVAAAETAATPLAAPGNAVV